MEVGGEVDERGNSKKGSIRTAIDVLGQYETLLHFIVAKSFEFFHRR